MQNDLKRRILELSFKYKLSHIGSCLSAVGIIEEIYKTKQPNEKFVLSSGHAGLALYCVIEKYEGIDAEKIWLHHGVHPDRCAECHLYCSAGSLGHGLGIAVGMALADRTKNVYCLISDGECMEGSIWEALRIKVDNDVDNLKVYVNLNGYTAYGELDKDELVEKLVMFGVDRENIKRTTVEQLPFLKGVDAHYKVMSDEDYATAIQQI
jgi:transketolase